MGLERSPATGRDARRPPRTPEDPSPGARMTTSARTNRTPRPAALVLTPLLLLAAAAPLRAQDPAPADDPPAEVPAVADVFAVARDHGTLVLTMPDKKGPRVLAAKAGQLFRVTGPKRAAFLPVEVPGGYPVWVHGRNLRATDEEGVLRVTANAVLQRPLPSTGLESYPFEQRLHGGDLLRVIERKDAAKPLAEDWVRI